LAVLGYPGANCGLKEKEKREPFGSAQGKQAPALQNIVIYENKYITN